MFRDLWLPHQRAAPEGPGGFCEPKIVTGQLLALNVDLPHFSISSAMSLPKLAGAPPTSACLLSSADRQNRRLFPNSRTTNCGLETWLALAKLITGTKKGTGDNQASYRVAC